MRKTTGSVALLLAAGAAAAQEKVTVQLKWVPQAQFAGYYVAAAKGFYKDAGLDVTIKPGGPDIAPAQVIAGQRRRPDGGLDAHRPGRARGRRAAGQRGADLQPQRHDAHLQEGQRRGHAQGLQGQDAGRLVRRQRVPLPQLDGQARLQDRGANPDIKMLKQGFNVDPLLQNQAACISTMIYNEYWQVIDAGVKPDQLVTFFYEDQGVATLEDGLYVLEPS